MKKTLPTMLILFVAVALCWPTTTSRADDERSIVVGSLAVEDFPALGSPIVAECTLPAKGGLIAYDWRVVGKQCSFLAIGDGRTIHVWSAPGEVRIELVVAIDGDGPPVIHRFDKAITVGGSPPEPAPVDKFAARARAAVPDEADRRDIAALAGAMAASLIQDGDMASPKLLTTADVGKAWADMQRVYHGNDSPYGERLAAFEAVAGQWLSESLKLTGDALPLDTDNRREHFAAWFLDLGGAMR